MPSLRPRNPYTAAALTILVGVLWSAGALADPLPPFIQCEDTGGQWTECGSGCGPFTCDNPESADICPAVCIPQCICPGGEVWDDTSGCIPLGDCDGGNGAPPPPGSTDKDGDGWSAEGGDCDDSNPDVYPGAPEPCDGLDNDCNGIVDDGCDSPTPETALCADSGGQWNECGSGCGPFTCDNPTPSDDGCPEVCVAQCICPEAQVWDDALGCISAEDCGEPPFEDKDGDGWSQGDGDCDDTNAYVFPGAPEDCDGIDNNCDGIVDDGCDGPGADETLCDNSGGLWEECGSGCGPFTCDNPTPPESGECPAVCVAQCACPGTQIWDDALGCIPVEDCGGESPEPCDTCSDDCPEACPETPGAEETLCDESGGGWEEVGDCGDGAAECPSLCVCPADSACWNTDQGCHVCPEESTPAAEEVLCEASEGIWTDCGSGCGPFTCAQPALEPETDCPAMCVPQCECPVDHVWDADSGCIPLSDCEEIEPEPSVPPADSGGSGDDGGCAQTSTGDRGWMPVWMALATLLFTTLRRRPTPHANT